MKYKAKDSYKDLDDKYFQYGTAKLLLRGGTVQLEKKDFEMLKVKESKRDIFGPLTTKETERLQNLNVKREKEDEDILGDI